VPATRVVLPPGVLTAARGIPAVIALRGLLAGSGFDPRRLRLEWITPDDPHDFVEKITDFTNLIRALGPSPVSYE